MNKKIKQLLLLFSSLILFACGAIELDEIEPEITDNQSEAQINLVEGESYSSLEEVINYVEYFGELPPNYLTKEEARELGWVASEGNLWDVAPGSSIGGDYFGNFEGLLPKADDREYFEADIDYEGGFRNAKRLVFSNDGLYFYTDDHYDSFTEMEPGGEE